MVHAMNRMNQQQMAWRSDAQQYGAHYGSFNPDARLNPHDVFHTGPGQFQRVGRFDPMKSSVKGGIFGGEQEFNAQPNVQPNIEAIQRVKSRPTGGGDFLDRLALAEQRDEELPCLLRETTLHTISDDFQAGLLLHGIDKHKFMALFNSNKELVEKT